VQEAAARARQIRYFQECALAALPGDPQTAPPSYRYFVGMVERLRRLGPADLTENSVLLGAAAQIAETLKKVEAAGFAEVILYFNVGLKPHAQVKDEMARFAAGHAGLRRPIARATAARQGRQCRARRCDLVSTNAVRPRQQPFGFRKAHHRILEPSSGSD
jgi:hypothetical protein